MAQLAFNQAGGELRRGGPGITPIDSIGNGQCVAVEYTPQGFVAVYDTKEQVFDKDGGPSEAPTQIFGYYHWESFRRQAGLLLKGAVEIDLGTNPTTGLEHVIFTQDVDSETNGHIWTLHDVDTAGERMARYPQLTFTAGEVTAYVGNVDKGDYVFSTQEQMIYADWVAEMSRSQQQAA